MPFWLLGMSLTHPTCCRLVGLWRIIKLQLDTAGSGDRTCVARAIRATI